MKKREINLKVKLGKMVLNNPVIAASGTFGCGREYSQLMDINKLGAITTKTITLKPRCGNPPPRIVETPAGMLNAIGLENPGVEIFIAENENFLKSLKVPIIVSIAGTKAGEYACLAKILSNYKWVAGLELNISCPNVKYKDKRQFAQDPKLTSQVVSQVRKVISKTIITKLSPNVSNIVPIARAAAKAGSDVISVINTLIGMSINIHNYRPLLGNVIGGLSGPAIRPVALRMTYEAARSVKIPVIGMGGITNADDALQFLICGARAVEVGTANFINPRVMLEISRGMEHYLKDKKLIDIKQIIGKLKI